MICVLKTTKCQFSNWFTFVKNKDRWELTLPLQNTVLVTKNRHIDQRNQTKSTKMSPDIYDQLVFKEVLRQSNGKI